MRLLVVGGAGFLGSVVVAHLNEAGHDVTICDNLSTGNAWAVNSDARCVPADMTNEASMGLVFSAGFDAVLNLSSFYPVDASIRRPVRSMRADVTGALNLLHAMERHGVTRLVHSSTAAVYSQPGHGPVAETAPTGATNPYAAAKLFIEEAIGFQADATGLGAVSLRCFNVAGASGPLGEWHHPETHLIPVALQVAAGIEGAVTIFGGDHATPDGTAVRDYVHVADVARAYLAALEATAVPGHRVYNIGSGVGHSVRQVLEVVRSATGCTIPGVEAPSRDGDPSVLVASIARAAAELGWVPRRSELDTVVGDAWTWLQTHLGSTAPTLSSPGVAA
jgi:UDP-glucose 4-epimerase